MNSCLQFSATHYLLSDLRTVQAADFEGLRSSAVDSSLALNSPTFPGPLPPRPIFQSWKGRVMKDPSVRNSVGFNADSSSVFVTKTTIPAAPDAIPVPSTVLLDAKALPLEWLLAGPRKQLTDVKRERDSDSLPTSDRILARLVQLEAHEPDVWLRDDIREAFIVVSLAAKGNPQPLIDASYICFGIHPDAVWPSIIARRQALLGNPTNITSARKQGAKSTPARRSKTA